MSRKRSSIIKYTLSFFLPAGILLSVMFLKGMWPFGDRSMLLWDMEIQYINIYNWYHDVLHGNAHIFYDFSKSLGGNMFGVFASYLASPLCLLTWFFPPEKMTHFIVLSTLIKTALSGLAMSIYLNRRFDLKPDAFNILFSVSYALMEYNVGLCSNLHFLDAIYTLPIAALGTYYLVKENKKRLFILSVAYMIVCNWYIGYMACFFLAFYFLFELAVNEKADRLHSFIRFAFSAILGAMIASVTLLPSLLATTEGKAEVSLGYLLQGFHCDPLEPLKGLLLSAQANSSYEVPAIFAGGLAVIIVLLGLFDTKIPLKTKLAGMGLISIVYLSFSFVPLEVVWTALKKTYSFHFRYSFVFCFALIAVAALFYENAERLLNPVSAFGTLAVMVCYGFYGHRRGFFFLKGNLLYFLLLAAYIMIIPCRGDKKIIRYLKTGSICVLLCLELAVNANLAFGRYRITCSEYDSYTAETEKMISAILQNDKGFYRLEKTFSEMDQRRGTKRPVATEGLTYDYNAVTHYSSLVDKRVNDFLYHTGYKNSDITQADYVDSNPVTDSMLGLKYLLSTHDEALLEKTGSGIIRGENAGIYENKYALKLITPVRSAVLAGWNGDPFDSQQKIADAMTGSETHILDRLSFERQDDGSFIIDVSKSGPVYIYMSEDEKIRKLVANGRFVQDYFGRFYNNVCCIGEYKAGDRISLELVSEEEDEDPEDDISLYAYVIDADNYWNVFGELQKASYDPDHISDTKVQFVCNSDGNDRFLVTIPFDKGWKITVDGKKYDAKPAFDTFYLFELPEGIHEVEMRYIPPYFILGCLLSLAGIIITVAVLIKEKASGKG